MLLSWGSREVHHMPKAHFRGLSAPPVPRGPEQDKVKRGSGRRMFLLAQPPNLKQTSLSSAIKRLLKRRPWHVVCVNEKPAPGPWALSLPHPRPPLPLTHVLPQSTLRGSASSRHFSGVWLAFPSQVFSLPLGQQHRKDGAPQSLSRMDRVWDLRCTLRSRN